MRRVYMLLVQCQCLMYIVQCTCTCAKIECNASYLNGHSQDLELINDLAAYGNS